MVTSRVTVTRLGLLAAAPGLFLFPSIPASQPIGKVQAKGVVGLALKGAPVIVCQDWGRTAVVDKALDCSEHNAVSITVLQGAGQYADIQLKGSNEQGGNYTDIPDPNGLQYRVHSNLTFDVLMGQKWLKVEFQNISGTLSQGQGFTVIATPYQAAGPILPPQWYRAPAHSYVNVGSSSTPVVALNRRRKYLLLQNISDTAIYLNLADVAFFQQGIELRPVGNVGSTYEMCMGRNLTLGAIEAMHNSTGSKVLLVTEGE